MMILSYALFQKIWHYINIYFHVELISDYWGVQGIISCFLKFVFMWLRVYVCMYVCIYISFVYYIEERVYLSFQF